MSSLEASRVGWLPSIYYIPQYLSSEEQIRLLHQVNAVPTSCWKTLKNRRLQNWGGMVHEKGLLPQKLPVWLSTLTGRISDDFKLFPSPLNHVLINEYLPGQGILPHQDGPAYFPVVAILSLGSPAVMHFMPHKSADTPDPKSRKVSVVLLAGSLLIFKDSAYQDYLHGIDECFEHELDDTVVNPDQLKSANVECKENGSTFSLPRDGARISLTCRVVPKVLNNFLKL